MFSWTPSDMPGVPREVIEHHLAMCPQAHPMKQKTRKQAQEKQDFIVQEIEKLKKAKLIREVAHPTWIANPVVVPKSNGSGRLCVDFTSLNKAYPKDPYPLPRIDQIVDSTADCDLLASWMLSPAIIRSRWQRRMKRRPPSSRLVVCTAMSVCPSA
jgi:putative transposase